jgi:hypothetical protein
MPVFVAFSFLRNPCTVFFTAVSPFYNPMCSVPGFQFCLILTNTCYLVLLTVAILMSGRPLLFAVWILIPQVAMVLSHCLNGAGGVGGAPPHRVVRTAHPWPKSSRRWPMVPFPNFS